MSEIKKLDQEKIVNSYARFDAVLVKGKGSRCWDEDGKEYIDFTSGIGVNSLGFADPDWSDAVCNQATTLQHISNLYYTLPNVRLAEKLTAASGFDKVFFANSGAEANEGAIKIARKYSFDQYGRGRDKIVTLVNSFHGRTVTTLAATGQEVFHNYFFPFTEGFVFAQANDLESLKAVLDDSVCAVMYEHIQGEGGVLPLEKEFVTQMKALCEQRDILLIADEVQTGAGRTGKFLAWEHFGVKPDIVTMAKGLGGGLPIGAILCSQKTSSVLGFGDHGTTFGGNPVVCAGANVCMDKICRPEFLQDVERKASVIRDRLADVEEVADISGLGLMIGIALKNKTAKEVVSECLQQGLLILTAKTKLRLLPPLNISEEELNRGLDILISVLK